SRGDLALEYQPGRGAHQPAEDAETPDVWPRTPRSPQPPLPAGAPCGPDPGGRRTGADTGPGRVATRTTRGVVSVGRLVSHDGVKACAGAAPSGPMSSTGVNSRLPPVLDRHDVVDRR